MIWSSQSNGTDHNGGGEVYPGESSSSGSSLTLRPPPEQTAAATRSHSDAEGSAKRNEERQANFPHSDEAARHSQNPSDTAQTLRVGCPGRRVLRPYSRPRQIPMIKRAQGSGAAPSESQPIVGPETVSAWFPICCWAGDGPGHTAWPPAFQLGPGAACLARASRNPDRSAPRVIVGRRPTTRLLGCAIER